VCSICKGSYESKNKDPKEAHKHTQRRLDDYITLEQMLQYEVLQKLTRFMSQVCRFMSSGTVNMHTLETCESSAQIQYCIHNEHAF
jgi:hypothetical protein